MRSNRTEQFIFFQTQNNRAIFSKSPKKANSKNVTTRTKKQFFRKKTKEPTQKITEQSVIENPAAESSFSKHKHLLIAIAIKEADSKEAEEIETHIPVRSSSRYLDLVKPLAIIVDFELL